LRKLADKLSCTGAHTAILTQKANLFVVEEASYSQTIAGVNKAEGHRTLGKRDVHPQGEQSTMSSYKTLQLHCLADVEGHVFQINTSHSLNLAAKM
jgi:hypothetical protein